MRTQLVKIALPITVMISVIMDVLVLGPQTCFFFGCIHVSFLRDSRITTTSALMFASRYGHREIAQLLVDRGTVVYAQEKVGNCAFPIKNS